MIKYLVGISLFCLIIGCTQSPDRIESQKLLQANPTSYTFKMPVTELRDTVIKMFGIAPQMDNPILKTVFMDATASKEYPIEIVFSPETSQKVVFGQEYFKGKNTDGDIYLTSMGGFWLSPLYFHGGKPFEYITPFVIQFKKITKESTQITIKAIEPKIVNGTECCDTHGNYSRMELVKPTTVEEYTLLTYIADKLGVKGLKPIVFPK
jgi:hypothetical protein